MTNRRKQPQIKDNPSMKKYKDDLTGISSLEKLYNFLKRFGVNSESLDIAFTQVPSIKQQFVKLSTIPDKFNELFSKSGWIATEMMSFDLMEECVKLAEEGRKTEAERKLIEYYSSKENLDWLLRAMNGVVAFRPRLSLAMKAQADHLKGRYYASIPLVLMIIDGIVNDTSETQTGFHAINTDMEVWDTIVGHDSGLNKLKEIITTTRHKTTDTKITLPYRHGILHGRDLNYGNIEVSAKTWFTLFAIGDWARAKQNEKYKKLNPPKKAPSLWENLKAISESKKQQKEMETWKVRDIVMGKDLPINGKVEDYEKSSPERKLVEYFSYITAKNYGKMASCVKRFPQDSMNKQAGQMREMCKSFDLIDFELVQVKDDAPAVTEIEAKIVYKTTDGYKKEKVKTFRLINEDAEGNPTLRGFKDSEWVIYSYYLGDLN